MIRRRRCPPRPDEWPIGMTMDRRPVKASSGASERQRERASAEVPGPGGPTRQGRGASSGMIRWILSGVRRVQGRPSPLCRQEVGICHSSMRVSRLRGLPSRGALRRRRDPCCATEGAWRRARPGASQDLLDGDWRRTRARSHEVDGRRSISSICLLSSAR